VALSPPFFVLTSMRVPLVAGKAIFWDTLFTGFKLLAGQLTMNLKVDPQIEKQIIALADATGSDPQALTDKALRYFVEHEAGIIAKICAGMEAADRGDVVPHNQVIAEIEAMIATREHHS
jgi:predicted transcriptional regulator